MIKVATVCTGVGAPEMALRMMGVKHEIAFGCEIDKYARTTYQANFNPHTMYTDMTKESWKGDHYYADLFVGGIPCQAFSLAGKRLGELDPRGLLFYNFYDYVDKQRPKAFVIENVKGLLSDNNGKTFQNWIQLLARSVNTQEILFPHADSLRYNLHYTVLNAKDFGLPQNRERVFIVGIREDLPNTFRFPVGWPLEIRLKDVLESEVDEKYYLSDTMLDWLQSHSDKSKSKGNGFKFQVKEDESIANAVNARTFKMGVDDNYVSEDPIPVRMVGRNPDNPKSRKSGEYREQTIEAYEEGICGTITTVQKDNLLITCEESGSYKIQNRIRRLTPRECFRLQGFPDSFDISQVSDTQGYKQAGNSIPTTVLMEIMRNLRPILE